MEQVPLDPLWRAVQIPHISSKNSFGAAATLRGAAVVVAAEAVAEVATEEAEEGRFFF